MPFLSKAQQAWGHSPAGVKALGGPAKVKEWDAATNFSKLPERVQHLSEGGLVGGLEHFDPELANLGELW